MVIIYFFIIKYIAIFLLFIYTAFWYGAPRAFGTGTRRRAPLVRGVPKRAARVTNNFANTEIFLIPDS